MGGMKDTQSISCRGQSACSKAKVMKATRSITCSGTSACSKAKVMKATLFISCSDRACSGVTLMMANEITCKPLCRNRGKQCAYSCRGVKRMRGQNALPVLKLQPGRSSCPKGRVCDAHCRDYECENYRFTGNF